MCKIGNRGRTRKPCRHSVFRSCRMKNQRRAWSWRTRWRSSPMQKFWEIEGSQPHMCRCAGHCCGLWAAARATLDIDPQRQLWDVETEVRFQRIPQARQSKPHEIFARRRLELRCEPCGIATLCLRCGLGVAIASPAERTAGSSETRPSLPCERFLALPADVMRPACEEFTRLELTFLNCRPVDLPQNVMDRS